MTVTRGFFDQYSVFCVFGSVVGCVVVPLITQSMECMILSALVISLTAAHLNKKASENAATKIVVKEGERKKVNQLSQKKKTNVQAKDSSRNEDEYIQQFEHLKLIETERRLEEKKLRKWKKREEKLKRREEEMKKQQDLERKVKHGGQEKKLSRQSKDLPKKQQGFGCIDRWPSPGSSIDSVECSDNAACYMQRQTSADDSRRRYILRQQRIPRFERLRLSSVPLSPSSSSSGHSSQSSTVANQTSLLSIRCPSLSTSCSSLSSVGSSSWSESSNSPPLSKISIPPHPPKTSTPPPLSPWKLATVESSFSPLKMLASKENRPPSSPDLNQVSVAAAASVTCVQAVRPLHCQPNALETKLKAGLPFDSCSLFSSSTESLLCKSKSDFFDQGHVIGSEYSLFGPARFTTSIIKGQQVL